MATLSAICGLDDRTQRAYDAHREQRAPGGLLLGSGAFLRFYWRLLQNDRSWGQIDRSDIRGPREQKFTALSDPRLARGPTERARVCHGARTFSWPRDARATSLRALTRAVTLDQRHAPHSLLSCSLQPTPIAKLSLCENTGGTRYAGSRKERGEALRDSRASCESCVASFAPKLSCRRQNVQAPKSHP